MQNFNWNYPTNMWVGENRIKDLVKACKKLNINKPLLVTDNGLAKSTIVLDAVSSLIRENISVKVYSNVVGNPTGSNVTDAVEHFKNINENFKESHITLVCSKYNFQIAKNYSFITDFIV